MGGMKDQLLKAGLVNAKQVKQAQQQQRKAAHQAQSQGKDNIVEGRQCSQSAQAEKAERDRQLNLQRQEAASKKALAAQVRQMIEAHRLTHQEGDLPFNFVDSGRVKRLYLDATVRRQLTRGSLAIVRLGERYELVPNEVAERIRARDPDAVVLAQNAPESTDNPDDRYADFPVPDDLIW